MLSGLARQIAPQQYVFTGQQRTLHSLSELGRLNLGFEPQNMRRYLPGSFVFELNGKRQRELMETPESIGLRVATA